MPTILLIEDEQGLAQGIIDAFQFHNYTVLHAASGGEGIGLATERIPDAIILDLMLPDVDGFEVCRTLRAEGLNTLILMLTSRSDEVDRVVGLEIGADDYITKPFSMRELIARVKAHLRRTSVHEQKSIKFHFGNFRIDFQKFRAYKDDEELTLTSTEFSLLELLIEHKNEVVTREDIMNQVRGYEYYPNSRTVDNHIMNLRQKIESDPHKPEHILTVHGIGYKFVG